MEHSGAEEGQMQRAAVTLAALKMSRQKKRHTAQQGHNKPRGDTASLWDRMSEALKTKVTIFSSCFPNRTETLLDHCKYNIIRVFLKFFIVAKRDYEMFSITHLRALQPCWTCTQCCVLDGQDILTLQIWNPVHIKTQCLGLSDG